MNLIKDNGSWDTDKLAKVFTAEAIQYIMSIKPPIQGDIVDSCYWRWTSKHGFELKSTYNKQIELTWEIANPIWNTIWSLQVPQRIQFFLWLSCRQKIMTNSERYKRSLAVDPSCPICHVNEETTLNVLRDCNVISQSWLKIIPPSLLNDFFTFPISEWLKQNLESKLVIPGWNIPWNIFFVSFLWHTWKNRNDFIFSQVSSSPDSTLAKSITWARYYHEGWQIQKPNTIANVTQSCWQHPEPGWLCLNVDGSVSSSSELWAIYIGLQLAWSHGAEVLQIQSDSKQAIQLIQDFFKISKALPLIRAINEIRKQGWMTEFHWTSREGNKPADILVKMANISDYNTITFATPPVELLQVLAKDSTAPSNMF
ncbi:hypothetical protein V6N11_031589 [Hibiscus sabdariffa]|uniref:Reverse transcriptase zinc-binding domain-containing protein n=1 Tax=Hibiscus sabdariffa TaxID=183260 RepID=A0ABR2SYV6_9ROSI